MHSTRIPAAIYARVSSQKQMKEGNGLNSQITMCYHHCSESGFDVVEIFQDDTTDGSADREGLEGLTAWLGRNKNKGVVVVLDAPFRLNRDIMVYRDIKRAIAAAGARLSCPEGEPQEIIQVSADQYQRQSNAAQTRRRTRARLMDGYWSMRVPFGYRSGGKGKVMVPDETYAPIAKAALEGYACGRLRTQEDVRLFIETHPTFISSRKGQKIGNSAVDKMLNNVLYTGCLFHRPWNVGLRQAKHAPLISMKEYEQIQARLRAKPMAPSN